MKKDFKYLLLYFLGSISLLFIIVPIINMYFSIEIKKLFEVSRDTEVQSSIQITLLISFVTTLIFSIFAIPLAYILSRTNSVFKTIILGIINIPIVIPHSAAGIALLGLVSRETIIGRFASTIGLNLIDSPVAIGIAMAYVSLPFLIITSYNGFKAVPIEFEMASRNLGATRWQTFLNISLPLSRKSIISGLILMFSRGISEFGAVIMLAYFPTITPILIYQKFTTHGLIYAQPIAIIFVSICLFILIAFYMLSIITKNKC